MERKLFFEFHCKKSKLNAEKLSNDAIQSINGSLIKRGKALDQACIVNEQFAAQLDPLVVIGNAR